METKEKSTIELWREANPNHVAERLDPLEKSKDKHDSSDDIE